MEGVRLALALGVGALAAGPAALLAWNEGEGSGGFASPVGGEKWYAPRPGFFTATGLRAPELSPTGRVFNWTEGREARFRFERLDRSKSARVTLRIQGMVRDSLPSADVVFAVDGAEVKRLPTPSSPTRVTLELPPRQRRGAVVSLWVEEPAGVMVENVRLSAASGVLYVPFEARAALSVVSLFTYIAVLLAGGPPWAGLASAVLTATAMGWLSIVGGAFLGGYSERLMRLALIFLALSLMAIRVRNPLWRRATIAVLGVTIVKLAVLAHPSVLDGDASRHAQNLARARSGDWYLTSATPPPAIVFPYPQGLSAAALPFSDLPRDQWVTLLRNIVVTAEVLGAAVTSLVISGLSSPAVGALTFLFMALQPEGVLVLFVGNLSNLFASPLLVVGCCFLLMGRQILSTLTLLGAFLSHFGTVLLGAPLSAALALWAERKARNRLRRAVPVLAAAGLSLLLYYRHFGPVFIDGLQRILHLREANAVGPMTAPWPEKLYRMSGGQDWWITAVLGLAMAIGVATWPEQRLRLARILRVWALVIAGFVLLGLLTPIMLRTALAARPLVAVLAASGVYALWWKGPLGRVAASSLIALTAIGCWTLAVGFLEA